MTSIAKKIVNFDSTDFHMHTSSFSDGINTLQEMINFAGTIGLTEIVITDHSDACREMFEEHGIYSSAARWSTASYKNLENDVKVSFGVEGDLLDIEGNTCFTVQGRPADFCILSAHKDVFSGTKNQVTDATIKAMQQHKETIKFIGHPACNNQFGEYYDMEKLVEAANEYNIPLEINSKSIANGRTNDAQLKIMLEKGSAFYFNSDAHNLADLLEYRQIAAKYLQERGYISEKEYERFVGLYRKP